MTDQVYFWADEQGAWQLARRVDVEGTARSVGVKFKQEVLVQHLYSNRLEWVPSSKLRPYPASKIEEPTK